MACLRRVGQNLGYICHKESIREAKARTATQHTLLEWLQVALHVGIVVEHNELESMCSESVLTYSTQNQDPT